MSENQDKLVRAAIEIFTRYGFRKTSMGDVAAAAGLSRPTLYARFSNKEELLCAAIEASAAQALSELKEIWQGAGDLRQVLCDYCEHITVKQYDMIRNMPDSEEILGGMSGPGGDVMRKVHGDYAQALSVKFQSHAGCDAARAARLASFFVDASKGLKTIAQDRAALEDQLSLLVEAVVTQAGPAG